jgi:hypothetical protein
VDERLAHQVADRLIAEPAIHAGKSWSACRIA